MNSFNLVLRDPRGVKLCDLTQFTSLELSRAVNAVGALVITLPRNLYSLDLFREDCILEVWREVNGQVKLEGDTYFFVRGIGRGTRENNRYIKLQAYDLNYLLGANDENSGRIVAYAAGTSQADKSGNADDLLKEIVRENLGTSAIPARDLSAYLSVEADAGAAPSIRKAFSRRTLIGVMREICQASATNGTYLAFDFVASKLTEGFGFEFKTFVGARGNDRRWAVANSPIILNEQAGTLSGVEVFRDYSAEVTYAYAGGDGEGLSRIVQEASDSTRLNLTPFNRREQFIDARGTSDPTAILNEAEAALRANRPRLTFNAKAIDTESLRFGIEYNFGDYITAISEGERFDCRIDAYSLTVNEAGVKYEPLLRLDD